MGDGSLTFVVPVRDPRGVQDWQAVKRRMENTFASLHRSGGRTLVAASVGTELPPLPPSVALIEVALPYIPLPAHEGSERHAAVRRDKGQRIAAALERHRPTGHVMVVDYDDFVSRRITALVARNPTAPGWFVDKGYSYDGGPFALIHKSGFNRICGSSLVVRADLLPVADASGSIDLETVNRALGSHIFLRDDLEKAGQGLAAMPFPGAVYRIGYEDSTSPTTSIRRRLRVRRAVRYPQRG